MAPWRDTVPDQTQTELDGLLNAVLPFAKEMLSEYGEFFPYGAGLAADGYVTLVAGDPGTGEQPEAADVLAVLYSTLWARSDEFVATAAVSDVRLQEPDTSAIRVELEHRDGPAIGVLIAYEVDLENAAVTTGEVRGVSGDRRTWPAP